MQSMSKAWPYLQSHRAEPGDLKASRRRDFGAAVEQASQLFAAAANMPREAVPIALFYGTSQLGRAVCARSADGEAYGRLNKHGLRIGDVTRGPRKASVSVEADGLFPAMRDLVGDTVSGSLTGEFLLGVVAAESDFNRDSQYPALIIETSVIESHLSGDRFSAPMHEADIYRPPGWLADHAAAPDGIAGALLRYPGLEGIVFATPSEESPGGAARPSIRIGLPGPETYKERRAEAGAIWAGRTARDGFFGRTYVLPTAPNGQSIGLLSAWWLLLFILSNLARYYPGQWARCLDLDRSSDAVLIEEVMNRAQERIPDLVLMALSHLDS